MGRPPSISRAGAAACTTMPAQARHASSPKREAFAAGPPGHDDPELRGDHVEAPGTVVAGDGHRAAAARAGRVLRRQRHLDPRQVRGQRAPARPALGRALALQGGIALLAFRLALGDRLLEVLQAELQLRLGQALGPGAELHALEPQQQMPQPVVPARQRIPLGGHPAASPAARARRREW